jgi:hypothetical protein
MKELIGELVTAYYNDTLNSVQRREGKLLSITSDFIVLDDGATEIFIPREKCVRIEKVKR